MHVKKGDKVVVRTGTDAGKTGVVERAFPKLNRVLVSGVNVRKVHERATRGGKKGQVVERSLPIHASNVARVTK